MTTCDLQLRSGEDLLFLRFKESRRRALTDVRLEWSQSCDRIIALQGSILGLLLLTECFLDQGISYGELHEQKVIDTFGIVYSRRAIQLAVDGVAELLTCLDADLLR